MNSSQWKCDRGSPTVDRIQAAAPKNLPMPRKNRETNCNSVVNMARILVAEGVRDRAIERAVKAAAAAVAASGNGSDAAARRVDNVATFPVVGLVYNDFPLSNSFARHCAAADAVKLPKICKGSIFKQSSCKNGDNERADPRATQPSPLVSRHVPELRACSISVSPAFGSTVVSPSVHWPPPQVQSSASPTSLALRKPPQFKQTFRFEDNDLSAPFRQDLNIKKPVLNVLAPTDVSAEKSQLRRGMLLQQALKQSNLLGPGHFSTTALSDPKSSASAELGFALSNLSKLRASRPAQ